MDNNKFTNFGFESIKTTLKTKRIQKLFNDVSNSYDLMNDVMSLGVHRLWKKKFINQLTLKNHQKILDLAAGTGDIGILLQKEYSYKNLQIIECDLTPSMVLQGRNKAIDHGVWQGLHWCIAAGEYLPFKDESFDIITIAFGLRNATDISQILKECKRVLKSSGWFYCLEFSPTQTPLLSKLYDLYSFNILPFLGEKIANDRDAYQYLVESIRTFPSPIDLATQMENIRFKQVSFDLLSGGITAIHLGQN